MSHCRDKNEKEALLNAAAAGWRRTHEILWVVAESGLFVQAPPSATLIGYFTTSLSLGFGGVVAGGDLG